MIDYFNSISSTGDTLGFIEDTIEIAGGIDQFIIIAGRIDKSKGQKVNYNFASWQTAEEESDQLIGSVDCLSYDLEKWEKSRGEWANIAEASAQFDRVAGDNFCYNAGLSRHLSNTQSNVSAMAQYADIYNIHDHSYFKTRDWAGYVNFIAQEASWARSGNPEVKLEVLISVTQSGYTAEELYNNIIVPAFNSGNVDGVSIYHFGGGETAKNMLKELVALIRNAPTLTPPIIFSTPTPTIAACTKKSLGDANCDSHVDGMDFSIWLNSQCHLGENQTCGDLRADFNSDANVDNVDYDIWYLNRE
jgi:hypothetical protein